MKNEILVLRANKSWMYKSNEKRIIYDLVENLILFVLFYIPLAMILIFFLRSFIPVIEGLFLAVPVCYLTLLRRNHKLKFHILWGILSIVFLLLIPLYLLQKSIFLVILTLTFFISLYKRRSEIKSFKSIGFLIISEIFLAIYFIIASNIKINFIKGLITITAIVIALLIMIYIFSIKTEKLMKWDAEYSNKYTTRITNMKKSVIVSISIIFIATVSILWLSGAVNAADNFQDKIIAFFSQSREVSTQPPTSQQEVTTAPSPSGQVDLSKIAEDSKPNPILSFFFLLLGYSVIIFSALCVLYILWITFIMIRNNLLAKRYKKSDTKIFVSEKEILQDIQLKVSSIKGRLIPTLDNTNNHKIRKTYRKLVISLTKKKLKSQYTPTEIQNIIKTSTGKNILEITSLYEEARYNNAPCSDEDLLKLKNLITKL